MPWRSKAVAVAQRQAVVREGELLHVQASAVARARVGVATRARAPFAGCARPPERAAAQPHGVVAGAHPRAFGDGAAFDGSLNFAVHADLGLTAWLIPAVQRRREATAAYARVEPHRRLEVGERRACGAHSPGAVFGLGTAVEDVRWRSEALVAVALVGAVVAVPVVVATAEVTATPVPYRLNVAPWSISEVHFIHAFGSAWVVGVRRDLDANLDAIVGLRSSTIRQNSVGFVDQNVKLHSGKKREARVDHELYFRLVVAWLVDDGHTFTPACVENAARLEGVIEQVFVVAGHDGGYGQFGNVKACGIRRVARRKAAQN